MSHHLSTKPKNTRPTNVQKLETIRNKLSRHKSIAQNDLTSQLYSVLDLFEYFAKNKTLLQHHPLLTKDVSHKISNFHVKYQLWKASKPIREQCAVQHVLWNRIFLLCDELQPTINLCLK